MNVPHRVTVTVPMPGGGFFARQWIVDSLPLPDDMLALQRQPGARTRWPTPNPHPAGPCAVCRELIAQNEVGKMSDEERVLIAD